MHAIVHCLDVKQLKDYHIYIHTVQLLIEDILNVQTPVHWYTVGNNPNLTSILKFLNTSIPIP